MKKLYLKEVHKHSESKKLKVKKMGKKKKSVSKTVNE